MKKLLGRLVWAAISAGIAFGMNTQLRARFEPGYERGEPREQVGALVLEGDASELPSLAAHAVVAEVRHLGKVFVVRELSLRSVAALGGAAPSFELFAELPERLAGQHMEPSVLRGVELPVRESGRLGTRDSILQRRASQPGRVLTGSLRFADVRMLERAEGAPPQYHAEARLELQVETERGVDLVNARWSGRVIWE